MSGLASHMRAPLLSALPQSAPADTAEAAQPPSTADFIAQVSDTLADVGVWTTLLGTAVKILLIVGLAILVLRLIDSAIARWKRAVEDLPTLAPRRQRTYTIGNLLASTGRYVIWPLALIMILSELNVDVGALLATAGIAGLAIGFGAQTLVKDVIAGVFLLFDDTIHVGDLIRIGTDTGTVEEIGIRLIKVRKFDGEMLMVPAGELRVFGNRSIEYARVIVPVGLSYEQDIDTVLPVMERVANDWAAETDPEILMEDAPTVQGLMDFGASSVTARIVMKVRPGEQFPAERDIRMRLKRAFDGLGVEIPFPRRTIYTRAEDDPPARTIADPNAPGPADPQEPADGEAEGSE